ncbi:protein of unknown function [Cyclobacterium lianum]|uniref:DUF4625 domain-containing protein n=1 Tax=Cyclobacterium lianum TaxID=388280 RepID=A0A1M7L4R2_9BACT|nr:DUF4625 domain-containing protein [Cyclobacterium lianum]SHM72795.1 protein of unknown function [Cyclobacterium lianum]
MINMKFIHPRYFIPVLSVAGMLSCETAEETPNDLSAPVIGQADGSEHIEPENGEIYGINADHMHVKFSVEDASGIGQVRVNVHANFDGHSHARINNSFARLETNNIFSPTADNPALRFPEGSTRINIDGHETDIFWAGENADLAGPVIAGSYDVGIEATDIFGNQTSYADGSSYIATIQIKTPYAPAISVSNLHEGELEAEAGMPLTIQGTVSRTDHELSSPITFLWVRLAEEGEHHDDDDDGHNHRMADEDFFDKMWGSSAWLEDGNGPDLPHDEMLDLNKILSGENAIIVPASEDHLDLIIRAEDSNGNTTEEVFTIHIE